ncbi:MAG TPA: hypothetical protein VGS41_08010, partial [Chthonomonadales bacterium]|nr:hypothetical protein [Chthonomonadales bacterium]
MELLQRQIRRHVGLPLRATVAALLLLAVQESLLAQAVPGLFANPTATAPATNAPGSDPGIPCSEIISGNGAAAGYTLSHSNILVGTLTVYASGRLLLANRDYTFDAGSGSLFLAAPVSRFDTIEVFYRYTTSPNSQQLTKAVPKLSFDFGGGAMGLLYNLDS